MVRTQGTGTFSQDVAASGSITSPTGTYSASLTISGVPVATGTAGTTDHAALDNLDFSNSGHTGFGAAIDVATNAADIAALTTSGEQYLLLDGSRPMTGDLNLGTGDINNAATIKYTTELQAGGNILFTGNFDIEFIQLGGGEQQRLNSTGVRSVDGTPAAPAFRFALDPDTGFFRKAANTIGVSVGGIEALAVSGTGMGVVDDVTAGGSVTAAEGHYSNSLTVSGIPVMASIAGQLGMENGFLLQTATGTFTLVERAPYDFTIRDFAARTQIGTVSGTLLVDSAIVEGIDNFVVGTDQVVSVATANNAVSAGDRVTLSVSGVSNYQGFGFTYTTERS